MNKVKLILLLCTIAFIGKGQQLEYTLKDIVQLSRSQSTAWLSAETRKENNYWLYQTFKSDYNPQLVLSGNLPAFTKSVTPVTQPDGNVIFREVHNNTLSMQLGLSQIIGPTGTNISVFSSLNRYDDFIQDYKQFSGQPFSIGLSQPIFQYNQYRWDRKIRPLEYQESQKQYFEELEQISRFATQRFFDLLLAQIQLDIAQKNVQSNDTIYKIAEGRYNLGKITENELLQLELNLVNSELQSSQAVVNQQSASLNLKSFIGLQDDNVALQLTIPDEIPEFIVDEDVALTEAIKNKPDFIQFERQMLEAQQDVAQAKNSGGINMNLDAVYGVANQGLDVGSVYQNPGNNIQVGLRMSVPVVDWGRQKSRKMRALASQKLTEYQIEQDKETFVQEVLTQARNFNLLRQQLVSRKKSDEIAQKAYSISKQLFLIGKISVTDLNQSLASKDLAKQNYISSLRDFWIAYYELRQLTLYDFESNTLLVRDIQ